MFGSLNANDTIVEEGIIRIPEEYAKSISSDTVSVTLMPVNTKIHSKRKRGKVSSGDFSALKIDTRNWSFDREEANAAIPCPNCSKDNRVLGGCLGAPCRTQRFICVSTKNKDRSTGLPSL